MQLLRKPLFYLFLVHFLMAVAVSAQQPLLKDYDWEKEPKLHTLTGDELSEEEIVLKDKRTIEYFYDESSTLREYNLKHKIIKVNSDKAIKFNNRIYIPFNRGVSVVKERARVINSEGKVRELREDDVKVATDEESNQTLRYFAVEGVDIGSEIEYFYIVDKYPSFTGNIISLQSEEPVKNASVEIISPTNLVFATKSYNGLPAMVNDSTHGDLNYLKVSMDYIPKLKREESATYFPHLMQLIYKLDKDYFTGRKNSISYDEAAKLLYQNLYSAPSKKVQKKLEKLIDNQKFENAGLEEKVRKIENFVKSEFNVVDYSAESLGNLEQILESKVCNEEGMTKLLACLFTTMGVSHRIVLTTDRNQLKFDPDFEAYNFLQHYLVYFNDLDMYLAPSAVFLRLGFVPAEWTQNYGLLLEPFKMNEYQTALPKIKFIKAPSYDQNTDNLFVNVKFDEDFSKLDIDIRRESSGYYAQNTQPFYDFLNDEQKHDISEAIIKNISPDAIIHSVKAENEGGNQFGVKPFIVTSQISSGSFIEKAGQKYLFKVGELIGPQIEMYQEEERLLEVENDFARKYHRIIEFNVPDQYVVKNLDHLKMDVSYQSGSGDTLMAFLSDYTADDRHVTVSITEYYKQIVYPLELFEEYRKVINAAADFNKVGLILEKQQP